VNIIDFNNNESAPPSEKVPLPPNEKSREANAASSKTNKIELTNTGTNTGAAEVNSKSEKIWLEAASEGIYLSIHRKTGKIEEGVDIPTNVTPGLYLSLAAAKERAEEISAKLVGRIGGVTRRQLRGGSILDYASQKIDPKATLLGNRWLCRGGGAFVVAQSGMGKSSFSIQAAAQ
jgi:hypothetical protein